MNVETAPSHEVFISYSTKDKKWADAVCAVLESRRIRCWIAPRDITPGMEWGAALIQGIDGCKMMVLIFSGHANQSSHVRREVERVISKGRPVLPFRVEDIAPAGAMEFALSNTHWLDGFTPPVERHLDSLAGAVERLLGQNDRDTDIRDPIEAFGVGKRRRNRAIPIVVVLLFLFAGVWLVMSSGKTRTAELGQKSSEAGTASPPTLSSDDARMQGKWEVVYNRSNGMEATTKRLANNKEFWTFEGTHWESRKTVMTGVQSSSGTFALQQTAEGNLIDIKAQTDTFHDFAIVGIFEFEKDLLKVCYREPTGSAATRRPESFDTPRTIILKFKRISGPPAKP